MRFSQLPVAVLAGAALLTACEGEAAGPALQLDATTTGNIAIRVQTDTSRTPTAVFINDGGADEINYARDLLDAVGP